MQSVVLDLDGVVSAEADYREGTAVVVYDPTKVAPDQIVEQINSNTYFRASVARAFVQTATFSIPGLDSREEALELDRALRDVAGIVDDSLGPEQLTLDYDAREITPEQVMEIINGQTSLTASIETTAKVTAPEVASTATAVIRVGGVTDRQTSSRVTGALMLDGIVDGSVNTDNATLTIVYDPTKLTAQMIVDTLRQTVPNDVSLVSESESGAGGSLLTSAWFVLSLVALAIVAVFAGPSLRRRLQATTPAGESSNEGG